MTAKMAAAKMAKRCQASRVSPSGMGVNQMPMPSAKGATAFRTGSIRQAGFGGAHGFAPVGWSGPAAAPGGLGGDARRAVPLRSTTRPLTLPSSETTSGCHLKL